MVCLGLAGPGFLETMLWQGLFWQLSGGPCAPGGAFVGPINSKEKDGHVGALSGLALASWSYGLAMVCLGLAGPGFLETMLWQGLFWQLSGGPCAPGGAFVGPINEERRMAMLELCPAWPWLLGAMVSLWSRYGLAGPGFLETMLWQGLFWQLSGGPCAPGGAFVGPINEERRMAMLELCPAWPWLLGAMVSLWSAWVWLGRASLKPCSGKVCFGSFRVALVHLEALSSDQLMKREGWLCWSSVRLAVGYAFGWAWLLGAMVVMVWLGRASLKPCSGKVCFGSFRVALVHLEALSSDQLMKREGWLCWSSVRPGPGFLELWSRYGLAGFGWARLP